MVITTPAGRTPLTNKNRRLNPLVLAGHGIHDSRSYLEGCRRQLMAKRSKRVNKPTTAPPTFVSFKKVKSPAVPGPLDTLARLIGHHHLVTERQLPIRTTTLWHRLPRSHIQTDDESVTNLILQLQTNDRKKYSLHRRYSGLGISMCGGMHSSLVPIGAATVLRTVDKLPRRAQQLFRASTRVT